MTTDPVALLPTDVESRERIPGSPLVPGGVSWSEDGRLAVVSDSSVLVATFRSRELEMFQPGGPAVSKDFVFLPEHPVNEHVPVAIPPVIESLDSGLPRASTTYFLLNEGDRHQHNPKELSLSKNTGAAFIAAVWGPRGSGPSSSCALLAITASSRLSLHFPPSFHMNWNEVAVFSEDLFKFFESKSFRLGPSHDERLNTPPPSTAMAAPRGDKSGKKNKKRKMDPADGYLAMNSVAEYTHRCAMMSTLTVAWSPFMVTADKQSTTSLIAFSGRKVSTIWAYAYPSFVAGQHVEPFLSSAPVAWIDTEKYGWVSTSTWQQMHRHGTAYATRGDLGLALGTSEGNVLIATVPVRVSATDDSPQELAVDRVIVSPHSQPVFGLCMGSRWTFSNSPTNGLIVASGSTISVWNLKKKKQAQPNAKWKAHDGNVTGLDTNYFGDTIISAAVDGTIKVWEKTTGKLLHSSDATPTDDGNSEDTAISTSTTSKYPVFGLAMSPSSAQLACVFIIPPASRPNRKSQADVSYSRVSSSLEYIPSPWVKTPDQLVDVVCRILDESQSVSSFMDVVWFCYNDNAAVMSLNGSTDLAIPALLNKINGEPSDSEVLARQPIYLHLCEELEKRYYESTQASSSTANGGRPPIPLYLQASLLLRSAITPAEHQIAAQNAALAKIRRTLSVYWAERCLTALVAASKKAEKSLRDYLESSTSEKTSALVMADFLSVQDPLAQRSEALVTHIYDQLDSPVHVATWIAHVKTKANASTEDQPAEEPAVAGAVYTPPSRETCFICEKSVPFGELEIVCGSGHTLERCFLSFCCISAMDVWKCMGCGVSASEIDLSSGTSPFYLLDLEERDDKEIATPAASRMKIICRLCGSYCSFSKY
ncbi:putative zinc-finger of transcription factor IIIC complex [Phytophthora infestans]|uniref:Putative zinc-finger of transcription factor IIIC complex n=1 Tax=Phytophthora infestans TaxID=4787 RepID=A0A8S9TXW6_PHYIN|nr:putative zinc-finger of transcription factor IIIC complex [Phytophthora infestans]